MFDGAGIPHLRSEVGLFTWLDLSAWLRLENGGGDAAGGDPSTEAAAQLGLRLLTKMGIAMTSGRSMYVPVLGFFRVVFSAPCDEAWAEALRRLAAFAREQHRQQR